MDIDRFIDDRVQTITRETENRIDDIIGPRQTVDEFAAERAFWRKAPDIDGTLRTTREEYFGHLSNAGEHPIRIFSEDTRICLSRLIPIGFIADELGDVDKFGEAIERSILPRHATAWDVDDGR